jgi:hypothetical protein
MSTKACIARPDRDAWSGFYVHTDGGPKHTRRVLVEMVRALGAAAALEHAATAPQGWTRFPDKPSVFHDEPFILTPEQHGWIEWLYLLTSDREIEVYRGAERDDSDPRTYTWLATIDPQHPDAVSDMMALRDAPTGGDAGSAEVDDASEVGSFLQAAERLPTPAAADAFLRGGRHALLTLLERLRRDPSLHAEAADCARVISHLNDLMGARN